MRDTTDRKNVMTAIENWAKDMPPSNNFVNSDSFIELKKIIHFFFYERPIKNNRVPYHYPTKEGINNERQNFIRS